jgi:hypothetical protein
VHTSGERWLPQYDSVSAHSDEFAFRVKSLHNRKWHKRDSEKFNLQGSGAANFAALTVDQNYLGSGNALITFGGNQILVVGGANHIDASDFLF